MTVDRLTVMLLKTLLLASYEGKSLMTVNPSLIRSYFFLFYLLCFIFSVTLNRPSYRPFTRK